MSNNPALRPFDPYRDRLRDRRMRYGYGVARDRIHLLADDASQPTKRKAKEAPDQAQVERQARVDAAKKSNLFGHIRKLYNIQNEDTGFSMDESGNIIPPSQGQESDPKPKARTSRPAPSQEEVELKQESAMMKAAADVKAIAEKRKLASASQSLADAKARAAELAKAARSRSKPLRSTYDEVAKSVAKMKEAKAVGKLDDPVKLADSEKRLKTLEPSLKASEELASKLESEAESMGAREDEFKKSAEDEKQRIGMRQAMRQAGLPVEETETDFDKNYVATMEPGKDGRLKRVNPVSISASRVMQDRRKLLETLPEDTRLNAIRDLDARELDPDSWETGKIESIKGLPDEELAGVVEGYPLVLERAQRSIQEVVASREQRAAERQAELERIAQDNARIIESKGFTVSQLVSTEEGDWHKAYFERRNSIIEQERLDQEATQAELDAENAEYARDVRVHNARVAELQARQGKKQAEEQAAREAELKKMEESGMSGAATDLRKLEAEASQRQADVSKKFKPGSVEHQASLDAINKDIQAKAMESQQRAQKGMEKAAAAYADGFKDYHGSFITGKAEEGYAGEIGVNVEVADQAIKAKAKELGMSEKDLRFNLETMRQADWSKPVTLQAGQKQAEFFHGLKKKLGIETEAEPVRKLPDGRMIVNPAFASDEESYRAAIEASGEMDEVKKEAMSNYKRDHEQWLDATRAQLETSIGMPWEEGYMEFRDKRAGTMSENDIAEAFIQKHKNDAWYNKLSNLVIDNLVAGSHMLTGSAAGAYAIFSGALEKATGIKTGAQAASEFAGEKIREMARTTAISDLVNTGIPSRVAATTLQMVPGAAAAIATGGMGGAALMSAVQTGGTQYAQVYADLVANGLSHDEAWKQAAPAATFSGAMSAALTRLFPKGATAVLDKAGKKELSNLVARAATSFALLSGRATRGFADEALQETIDEGISQLSEAYSRGDDPRKAVQDFLTNLPEIVLSAGLMGAAGEVLDNKPEREAALNAQIESWQGMPGMQPEDVETYKTKAKTLTKIAQGIDITSLSAAELESIGWTTAGKPGKEADVYERDGQLVIRQEAINGVTVAFPAMEGVIGLSEEERLAQIADSATSSAPEATAPSSENYGSPSAQTTENKGAVADGSSKEAARQPSVEGVLSGDQPSQPAQSKATTEKTRADTVVSPVGVAEDAKAGPSSAPSPIDQKAHAAATSKTNDLPQPTEAQKQAGNYKMGHLDLGGVQITIENPDGSQRTWKNEDTGEAGSSTIHGHYGYMRNTVGADGDHIDVNIKTGTPEDWTGTVFVIKQLKSDAKTFDEHKVYIGYESEAEAKKAYKSNYQKGWRGYGGAIHVQMKDLADMVKSGKLKKSPSKSYAQPQDQTPRQPDVQPAAEVQGSQTPATGEAIQPDAGAGQDGGVVQQPGIADDGTTRGEPAAQVGQWSIRTDSGKTISIPASQASTRAEAIAIMAGMSVRGDKVRPTTLEEPEVQVAPPTQAQPATSKAPEPATKVKTEALLAQAPEGAEIIELTDDGVNTAITRMRVMLMNFVNSSSGPQQAFLRLIAEALIANVSPYLAKRTFARVVIAPGVHNTKVHGSGFAYLGGTLYFYPEHAASYFARRSMSQGAKAGLSQQGIVDLAVSLAKAGPLHESAHRAIDDTISDKDKAAIWQSLSEDDSLAAAVRSLYPDASDEVLGDEYLRALVERIYNGKSTEEIYGLIGGSAESQSLLQAIRSILEKIVSLLTGDKRADESNDAAKMRQDAVSRIIDRMEQILPSDMTGQSLQDGVIDIGAIDARAIKGSKGKAEKLGSMPAAKSFVMRNFSDLAERMGIQIVPEIGTTAHYVVTDSKTGKRGGYIGVNFFKIAEYTPGQAMDIMREEFIHAAVDQVLVQRVMKQRGISISDPFIQSGQYHMEFYNSIHDLMTPAERRMLPQVYVTGRNMPEWYQGSEFYRMAVQKMLHGGITEQAMLGHKFTPSKRSKALQAIKKIILQAQDFIKRIAKDKTPAGKQAKEVLDATIKLVKKIDGQQKMRMMAAPSEQPVDPQLDLTYVGGDEGPDAQAKRNASNPLDSSRGIQPSSPFGGATTSAALLRWAADTGWLLSTDSLVQAIERGGVSEHIGGDEHDVWFDAEENRAIKFTVDEKFVQGSPEAYIDNLRRTNIEFGTGYSFEGIADDDGVARIVTSQPWLSGEAATEQQIDAYFLDRGFKKVKDGAFFDPKRKLLVGDAMPRNVKRVGSETRPFDIQTRFASEREANKLESAIQARENSMRWMAAPNGWLDTGGNYHATGTISHAKWAAQYLEEGDADKAEASLKRSGWIRLVPHHFDKTLHLDGPPANQQQRRFIKEWRETNGKEFGGDWSLNQRGTVLRMAAPDTETGLPKGASVAYISDDKFSQKSRIKDAATNLSRLTGGRFGASERPEQIVQALSEAGVRKIGSIQDLELGEEKLFNLTPGSYKKIKGGHEHLVWAAKDTDGSLRAYKVRKPSAARVGTSTTDYLTRLDISNKLLNDDIRLEGVTEEGLVFWSHPWILGPGYLPRQKDVTDRLLGMGWVPDRHLNTVFHSPDGRLFIEDSHNANWVFDHAGNVWPIDIMFSTREVREFELEKDEVLEINGPDYLPKTLTEFWSEINSAEDLGFSASLPGSQIETGDIKLMAAPDGMVGVRPDLKNAKFITADGEDITTVFPEAADKDPTRAAVDRPVGRVIVSVVADNPDKRFPKLLVRPKGARVEPSGGERMRLYLFRQSSGWQWSGDAPSVTLAQAKDDNGMMSDSLVSVERDDGSHYLALEFDTSDVVSRLAYWPGESSILRPVVTGYPVIGKEVGRVAFAGHEFPVFDKITVAPHAQASLDDFMSKSSVTGVMQKSGWAIYTAANPNIKPTTTQENKDLNDALENELQDQGLQYEPVAGKYGNPENSFIVIDPGMSREKAADIAKKYHQHSILTSQGLVTQDGGLIEAGGIKTFDTEPDDNYTVVDGPDGKVIFSADIIGDWDNPTPLFMAAPSDELNLGKKADRNAMRQRNVKRIIERNAQAHPEALKVEYIKDGKEYRLDEKGLPQPVPVEYNLLESRVAKEAAKGMRGESRRGAYISALSDRLMSMFDSIKGQPEVMAGKEWYRVAREKLTKHFGKDTLVFAQLLAATSARTPVQQNFEQALDAYNGIKTGRFDGLSERYMEAIANMEAGGLFFRQSMGNAKMGDAVTPKNLRDYLDSEGILPRRENGKKYNANSMQVLNVIAGVWREKLGGPKTAQFSDNLTGASLEATIDVWAARTLHRLSNEAQGQRWRILPEAETGVNNEDFAVGQAAFKIAASRLGMNPDDLQGVLWFAEKRLWADRGWTRAAGAELSDFSSLLDYVETEDGGKKVLRLNKNQGMLDLDYGTANTQANRQPGRAGVQAGSARKPATQREGAGDSVQGAGAGAGIEQRALFMAAPEQSINPGFYSKLQEFIAARMPTKASPKAVMAMIEAPTSGVKADEIKWSGIRPWLESMGDTVTRDEVIAFMRDSGQIRFQEASMGGVNLSQLTPEQRYAKGIDAIEGWLYDKDADFRSYVLSDADKKAVRDWSSTMDHDTLVKKLNFRGMDVEDFMNYLANERKTAKYEQYQLPGGENYREVVLSMPTVNARDYQAEGRSPDEQLAFENDMQKMGEYTSSHFRDIPNYLAHMRLNDRVDAEGRPGTFIEEIQSDRHQAGREKGYKGERDRSLSVKWNGNLQTWQVLNEDGRMVGGFQTAEAANAAANKFASGIPDAPFRTTWPLQMFKRALAEAVAQGKQWIGWTTGDTQAERYDLSKQIKELRWLKNPGGDYTILAIDTKGKAQPMGNHAGKKLPEVMGKELATKVIESSEPHGEFTGLDLKVGGEGMKGFYDTILPKEIGKYVKQWGAGVVKSDLGDGIPKYISVDTSTGREFTHGKDATPIWRVDITPQMRESVSEKGQPLFMAAPDSPLSLYTPGDVVTEEDERSGEPITRYSIPGVSSANVTDDGFIWGLKTDPKKRGRGAARAVMERIIEDRGGEHIGLVANADGGTNAPTQAELESFYKSLGFEEDGKPDDDGQLMIRKPVMRMAVPEQPMAPNGKPSNLSPKQWATVRTPAFKAWFGDWEKWHNGKDGNGVWSDADGEVSKIVDENGEPMLMYHGSREAGFDRFDMTKAPGQRPNSAFFSNNRRVARTYSGSGASAEIGKGHQIPEDYADGATIDRELSTRFVYVEFSDGTQIPVEHGLSDDETIKKAVQYAEDESHGHFDPHRGIYEVFLNIRNPLEDNFEGANWDGSRESQYAVYADKNEEEVISDEKGRQYFDYERDAEELASKHEGSHVGRAQDHHQSTNDVASEAYRSKYDGAIIRDVRDDGGEFDTFEASDVVVVFDAENIKDANNNKGTFDINDSRLLFMAAPTSGEDFDSRLMSNMVKTLGNANIPPQPTEAANIAMVEALRIAEKSPETVGQWERKARAMIKEDRQAVIDQVIRNYYDGASFGSPELAVAASMLQPELFSIALQTGNPEHMKQAQAFAYAASAGASQAGRELRALRNRHRPGRETVKELLSSIYATVPARKRGRIAAAPTPMEKQKKIAALQKRIKQLEDQIRGGNRERSSDLIKLRREEKMARDEKDKQQLIEAYTASRREAVVKALKAEGLSEDDIFIDAEERLAAHESDLVKSAIAEHPNEHKDAIGYLMRGYSHDQVSKLTGLPVQVVASIHERFRNITLKKKVASWVNRGRSVLDMVRQGVEKVFGSVMRMAAPKAWTQVQPKIDVAVANEIERQLSVLIPTAKQVNNGKLQATVVRVSQVPYARGKGPQTVTIYTKFNAEDFRSVYRMARSLSIAEASYFDKLYEFWINNLLSGIMTNVVNVIGNTLSTAIHFIPQRALEIAWNLGGADTSSASMGEIKHIAMGIMPGVRQALANAWMAFDVEADPIRHLYMDEPMQLQFGFKGDIEKIGGYRGPSIGGVKGRIARIPGRALRAMDAAFKSIIMNMEVGAMAYRLARKEIASGNNVNIEQFITQQVNTPGSEAWRKAMETSEALTLQESNWLTSVAKTVTQGIDRPAKALKQKAGEMAQRGDAEKAFLLDADAMILTAFAKIMQIIFPFVKTPANILRIGLRKSPLGSALLAMHMIHAIARGSYNMVNGRPFFKDYPTALLVKSLSEQAQAWAVVSFLLSASEGDEDDDKKSILFVGGRPYSEPGQREALYRDYGGSYILIIRKDNGKEVSIPFGKYEPVATALGTTIDALRQIKMAYRRKDADASIALKAIIGDFANQVEDKSFLQGFSTVMREYDAIKRSGDVQGGMVESAKKSILTALVPNIIRQSMRNMDDIVRDSKKKGPWYDALPLGDNAQPMLDLFGREVVKDEFFPMSRLLIPSANVKMEDHPIEPLIREWNNKNLNPDEQIAPTPMRKSDYYVYAPGGVKTKLETPSDKAIFEKRVGQEFARRTEELVKSLEGKPLPSNFKDLVDGIRSDVRRETRKNFITSPFQQATDRLKNPTSK